MLLTSSSKKRENRSVKLRDDNENRRTLDDAGRDRRLKKQLEALEQDNFQEDPHASLTSWHKKIPKFDESPTNTPTDHKKRNDKRRSEQARSTRFRKTFQQILDGEAKNEDTAGYLNAQAPPSLLPARHFCAVCGFLSVYTCVRCGARYCSLKCLAVHKDTRCLKWTV
uniref:HIT-type domain-containing protein n=1 Tax=Romanomermis culicivorax TaxID=13658 RepID=A0A915IG60_ROMCU